MSSAPLTDDLNIFDIERVRADFPILQREVHGKPLVYFDTAASAQRPLAVIEAVEDLYEQARSDLAQFINAGSDREVVFTRGTTESVNLVAQAFARPRLKPGDEIIVSRMEHHSNIVPWQIVCEQTGAKLRVAEINERGELLLDQLEEMLSERVRLIGLVHVSNALGTINPVSRVCELARKYEIPVLIDGAQAMPHTKVDVQALGCDFFCLSGHKMYGPTGAGALWARPEHLEAMPPWQGGGEMIRQVSFEKTEFNDVPAKFEAGTPNIAGAVGLGAAVRYLDSLGMDAIAGWEDHLLKLATERLGSIDGLRIIGTATNKASVVSFTLDGVHPHDLGTVIDHYGVALRTGHHCAMPVMEFFGVPATARVSIGLYNNEAEIEILANAIEESRKMFA